MLQGLVEGTKMTGFTWRARGLSKSFIRRVMIGVTPFRVLITLLITYLLSPLPLQVVRDPGFRGFGTCKGFRDPGIDRRMV